MGHTYWPPVLTLASLLPLLLSPETWETGVGLGSDVEVDEDECDGSGATEGTGVGLGVTLVGVEEVVVLEVSLPSPLQSSGVH